MYKDNLTLLSSDSNIDQLNTSSLAIDLESTVSEAYKIFTSHSNLPGVLVFNGNEFITIISKSKFFEQMSKPFSIELFLKNSIKLFIEESNLKAPLIIEHNANIIEAAKLSLQRSFDSIFEPIVIRHQDNKYSVLDAHTLLIAQNSIHLTTLDSLRKANELKSEMLRIASHDLKNPLTGILGFTQLILENPEDKESTRELTEAVYRSAKRMFEIVLKLLDTSAIEENNIKIEKEKIFIKDIILAVIKENKNTADRKKQKIVFNTLISENIKIHSDRLRIIEILDNLVSNAIKYSPFDSFIYVNLHRIDKEIVIEVVDEGPGLSNEDKQKAFTKFQRLSTKPTAGESSTGLGLYIVKKIVELLKGKITIRDNYPKGCIFTFSLPLS